MNIRWIHVEERLPRIHFWALTALIIWVVCVVLFTWLNSNTGEERTACLLKTATSIPCPTCGSTRVFTHITQGNFLDAFLQNPFVVVCGFVLTVIFIARLCFATKLDLGFGKTGRRIFWALITLLFLANWVYVIVIDGPW